MMYIEMRAPACLPGFSNEVRKVSVTSSFHLGYKYFLLFLFFFLEKKTGERGRRIVASNNFIAYALKNGQIRILDIATAARILLKSHKHQVRSL